MAKQSQDMQSKPVAPKKAAKKPAKAVKATPLAMKTRKPAAKAAEKASQKQGSNLAWNMCLKCSNGGCKSWIYIRKADWWAECKWCGQLWLQSFKDHGCHLRNQ